MTDRKNTVDDSETQQGWQRILSLAWEYSDRFDHITELIENPDEETSIEKSSNAEWIFELRDQVLEKDLPQIRLAARKGRDIRLGTRDYRIGEEILQFVEKWHDQQESFFGTLINGSLCEKVNSAEILRFIRRIEVNADHLRGQFQSLVDCLKKHISSELSKTKGKEKNRSQSEFTDYSQTTMQVYKPPVLESAHAVFIEVSLKRIDSLEKVQRAQLTKISGQVAEYAAVGDQAEEKRPGQPAQVETGAVSPNEEDAINLDEQRQKQTALREDASLRRQKAAMHGRLQNLDLEYPPVERKLPPVLNGETSLRDREAALHGLLLDLDLEYPPTPFAKENKDPEGEQ